MKGIQEQISELSTAAIVSGKFTAAQIIEVTGQGSPEQQLGKLQQMTESHDLTIPTAESHYTEKIAKLTEQLAKSGKVLGFQIVEALQSGSTQQERFRALESLAVAKKIGVTKVERKNGSAVVTESARPTNEQRVQNAMKSHKCSFREAHIICNLPDPGPNANESSDSVSERAERWRKYSGKQLKETEIQILAKRGVEPR